MNVEGSTALAGSSPLTRGKLGDSGIFISWTGLIPAHAGKTRRNSKRGPTRRAHPRSRGENQNGEETTPPRKGSSPLTRGKLLDACPQAVNEGLIPAHAGKTGACRSSTWQHWAHPRSRGENCSGPRLAAPLTGSSPLTRGKHLGELALRVGQGLIPAHAGKTRRARGLPK